MSRVYLVVFFLFSCIINAQSPVRIGVISDPHLHNIYIEDKGENLTTFYNQETKRIELVRSLKGQMESTRLFNENYFAFKQAVLDLVNQGVNYIIISGDYTDDGQLLNIGFVEEILKEYSQKFNIRFFLTNGNHEAVNSIDRQGGKSDFINQKGQGIGVYSSGDLVKDKNDIVYSKMKELGYESMYPLVKNYGFTSQAKDLFYNTPFHEFDYEHYTYEAGAFALKQRKYLIRGEEYLDFSYLVEPVEGIWILSIDGNMYDKVSDGKYKNISDGYSFIHEREYLFKWIKKITLEAEKRGKKLISFGHYPLLDFNNNLSTDLEKLLGKDKFQLGRVPKKQTQDLFVQTELQVYFAGHMHINQHGVNKTGNMDLWSIQVPSLAAFPPAYKLVEITDKQIEIKTVELRKVKDFDSLFKLYGKEVDVNDYKDFFASKDYYDLAKSHLKYLSEHRFLNSDFSNSKWDKYKKANNLSDCIDTVVSKQLSIENQSILKSLDFKTMVFDFYLIRNANDIGIKEIDAKRIMLYKQWSVIAENNHSDDTLDQFVIMIRKLMENSLPTNYLLL